MPERPGPGAEDLGIAEIEPAQAEAEIQPVVEPTAEQVEPEEPAEIEVVRKTEEEKAFEARLITSEVPKLIARSEEIFEAINSVEPIKYDRDTINQIYAEQFAALAGMEEITLIDLAAESRENWQQWRDYLAPLLPEVTAIQTRTKEVSLEGAEPVADQLAQLSQELKTVSEQINTGYDALILAENRYYAAKNMIDRLKDDAELSKRGLSNLAVDETLESRWGNVRDKYYDLSERPIGSKVKSFLPVNETGRNKQQIVREYRLMNEFHHQRFMASQERSSNEPNPDSYGFSQASDQQAAVNETYRRTAETAVAAFSRLERMNAADTPDIISRVTSMRLLQLLEWSDTVLTPEYHTLQDKDRYRFPWGESPPGDVLNRYIGSRDLENIKRNLKGSVNFSIFSLGNEKTEVDVEQLINDGLIDRDTYSQLARMALTGDMYGSWGILMEPERYERLLATQDPEFLAEIFTHEKNALTQNTASWVRRSPDVRSYYLARHSEPQIQLRLSLPEQFPVLLEEKN